MSLTDTSTPLSDEARQQGCVDLAAAFRWTARLNMHEGISNHFSYVVADDPCTFLVNPYGKHFSKMRASDLIAVDATDRAELDRDDVDQTAWSIHGAIHRAVPEARCIMHVHSKYATALASLRDKTLPAIDQNTARFFERVAIDERYDGMGVGDEAKRLATELDGKPIVLMGNHGFMAIAPTVAQAFDEMYFFERSAETYITALSAGRELHVLSDEVARKTARQWEYYVSSADRHLAALKEILDEEEPEYSH